MGPKKVSDKKIDAKNKKLIMIEVKKEIIQKHGAGVRVVDWRSNTTEQHQQSALS